MTYEDGDDAELHDAQRGIAAPTRPWYGYPVGAGILEGFRS